MSKRKVVISWSGGKDSAFALYKILLSGEYEVTSLHTVINEDTRRVGLHGVREELIKAQADALGLPVEFIVLPTSDNHDAYEAVMKKYYKSCKQHGSEAIVFGDIFLADLKLYREVLLKESTLIPIYPLWKIDTWVLVNDFVNIGFKTLICSANEKYFGQEKLGKTIDDSFLSTLPEGVDPCGENGEFHTFVYAGPIFKRPVEFITGETVLKKYSFKKKNEDGSAEDLESSFLFQDLLLRMD